MFIFTGPSALTVNITKNIENSSIVVQWDRGDDFFLTTYTLVWIADGDFVDTASVDVNTSYTITGLTLGTEYLVHVTPANRCGGGPEFRTYVSLSMDTASTSNLMTIIPTASPSSATSSTTTITSMIDPSTTSVNSMTTTFNRDIGTTKTITTTTNLVATATITVIEGSVLLATIISESIC